MADVDNDPLDGMEADISEALDGIADDAFERPEVPDAEPETGTEGDDEGPARTPDGKFAPKTNTAVEGTQPPANTTAPTEPLAGAPALSPPHVWSEAGKAAFATLPVELQQEIAQHERGVQEIRNKSAQLGRQLAVYEQAVGPHRERLAQAGVPVEHAVAKHFEIASNFAQNPAATLADLIRTNAIDPREIVHHLQNPQAIAQMQFQQKMQDMQGQIQQINQFRQQAETHQLEAHVGQLLADPRFPHADKMVDEITHVITEYKIGDFETAYKLARGLRPELFAGGGNGQAAPQAQAQKVAAKKAASVSAKGAPAVTSSPAAPARNNNTLDQDLQAAAARIQW